MWLQPHSQACDPVHYNPILATTGHETCSALDMHPAPFSSTEQQHYVYGARQPSHVLKILVNCVHIIHFKNNTVQCSTVQYSTAQYRTRQYRLGQRVHNKNILPPWAVAHTPPLPGQTLWRMHHTGPLA